MKLTFEEEIAMVINRHSKENESNTPDYVLAEYVKDCLDAFAKCSRSREIVQSKQTTMNQENEHMTYEEIISSLNRHRVFKIYGREEVIKAMTKAEIHGWNAALDEAAELVRWAADHERILALRK